MSINTVNNHPEMVEEHTPGSIVIEADAYAMLNEDIANIEQFSAQRAVALADLSELIDLSKLALDTTKWNEGKAKRKEQGHRISKALRRTIVMLRIAASSLKRQDKSKD